MKRLGLLTIAALLGVSPALGAQRGDALDRLKGCSQFEGSERLKCVDELLGEVAPEAVDTQQPKWIISETTSPVDYMPQISAVTTARVSSQDAPSSLAIRCRAQRIELVISRTGSWKQSADGALRVVYQIDKEPPVEERWRFADGGKSLVFQGDAVRLLRSIPDNGQIVFAAYPGKAQPAEGKFQLAGLDLLRRKIAAACKWPQP